MKAAVFDRFGNPEEMLQVRDVPAPAPARGDVRVRMLASPVNPSDLMTVRGEYGKRPTLPAVPGYEGVGVVEEVTGGLVARLRRLKPGQRVAVLNNAGGNWAEQVALSARNVVPIPDDIPDDQAAAFFVNPATAVALTRHVLAVPRGAWLLQTAAGGALGRMVVRLGQKEGFRTINVVRRREHVEALKALGADAVINAAEEPIADRVRALTDGAGVKYAIDPVGGQTGAAAVESLALGGRLVLYGTLAGEPIPLDSRRLMTGQKSVEGFWLSDWVPRQGVLTMLRLFGTIKDLLREKVVTTEVGKTYPLDQVAAAVAEAARPGRDGKVLLRIAPR